MVHQKGAGDGGVCGGIEAAFEGGEEVRDVAVEVAHFAGHGADHFGLVGGEVGEGLCAFGMLDLVLRRLAVIIIITLLLFKGDNRPICYQVRRTCWLVSVGLSIGFLSTQMSRKLLSQIGGSPIFLTYLRSIQS